MPSVMSDIAGTGPLTIVVVASLAVIIVDSLRKQAQRIVAWISLAGFASAFTVAAATVMETGSAYHGMVTTGGYSNYFAMVFTLSGFLCVLLSRDYLVKAGIEQGEFYGLLMLAVSGMMLMASAADLIVFFLGLEVMSVCFYILAGFSRGRLMSNEAALKYFLLGAFATGFLLYGIALVYGSAGTTEIRPMVERVGELGKNPLFLIGLALLVVGLSFKVAVVPFHMWVPDVYEGAPTTVTAFMSTGGKAAAFSFFLLLFGPAILGAVEPLRHVLAILAALSMIVGNLIAVAQSNVKRMLAYSSVAHAGYVLTGVVAGNTSGENGVLFYLMAYTVMNIGAFGVLSLLETSEGKGLTFDDYAGLSKQKPIVAGTMALFMFSLSGIPPFAGFFGKYYVFAGAIQAGYTWLAIVGVLMSAVSVYYYLRLVVMMYFRDGDLRHEERLSPAGLAAVIASAAAVIALGVFPSAIVNLTARFF